MSEVKRNTAKSQESRWVWAGHEPNMETGAEHFDCLHRDAHGTVLVLSLIHISEPTRPY